MIDSQEEATNDSSIDQTDVFSVIEEMPIFGNGGQEDIIRYFQQNTDYPATAIRDSIQGRVIVSFTIDEKGKVCNPSIMRGVRSDIDDECLRVVGNMPRWVPGNMSGKPIRVRYSVPLIFNLEGNPSQKGILIKPRSSNEQELNCKIYPNPAHDYINIRSEDQNIQVRFQIVNSSGHIVNNGLINESTEQIDISQLTNGIYFLNIATVDNLRSSLIKFIKN